MKMWQITCSLVFFGAIWYFWGIWAALFALLYLGILGAVFESELGKIRDSYDAEIYRLNKENDMLKKQLKDNK
jgi:hypothetical protein